MRPCGGASRWLQRGPLSYSIHLLHCMCYLSAVTKTEKFVASLGMLESVKIPAKESKTAALMVALAVVFSARWWVLVINGD